MSVRFERFKLVVLVYWPSFHPWRPHQLLVWNISLKGFSLWGLWGAPHLGSTRAALFNRPIFAYALIVEALRWFAELVHLNKASLRYFHFTSARLLYRVYSFATLGRDRLAIVARHGLVSLILGSRRIFLKLNNITTHNNRYFAFIRQWECFFVKCAPLSFSAFRRVSLSLLVSALKIEILRHVERIV
jgi:hypothetical protein